MKWPFGIRCSLLNKRSWYRDLSNLVSATLPCVDECEIYFRIRFRFSGLYHRAFLKMWKSLPPYSFVSKSVSL